MIKHITDALRNRRLHMGLTQRDVAHDMGHGTTQSMISEWETGLTVPTIKSVIRWARALEGDVSIHFED